MISSLLKKIQNPDLKKFPYQLFDDKKFSTGPILFCGDAGSGKTKFALDIQKLLGQKEMILPMSTGLGAYHGSNFDIQRSWSWIYTQGSLGIGRKRLLSKSFDFN